MNWHPRALRFLGFWRGVGRGLLLASLVVALLPAPAGMSRIANGDKFAHAAAFAFLMLWYAQIYAQPRDRLRCALGLVGFGLSISSCCKAWCRIAAPTSGISWPMRSA